MNRSSDSTSRYTVETRRKRLEPGRQLVQTRVRQQRAQRECLRDLRAQHVRLTRLAQILMRHRRRAHQRLSFRVPRQHDPDDPRMPFDEPLEQRRRRPCRASACRSRRRRRLDASRSSSAATAPPTKCMSHWSRIGRSIRCRPCSTLGSSSTNRIRFIRLAPMVAAVVASRRRLLRLATSGSRTKKVVPRPIAVSNQMCPRCFLTITAWAIARPWPVPRPTSLVVKNGSKIRARALRGIPVAGVVDADLGPVLDPAGRDRDQALAPGRSRTTSAIACAALISRLRTT